jgi:hypothetical protein
MHTEMVFRIPILYKYYICIVQIYKEWGKININSYKNSAFGAKSANFYMGIIINWFAATF